MLQATRLAIAMAISCSPITTMTGAVLHEVQDFGLGMRAGDDAKPRIDGAGLLHHLAALEGIGNGDEQAARLAQIRRFDHRRIGGVAGQSGDAPRFQFGDRVLVVLDDEERHVAFAPRPD